MYMRKENQPLHYFGWVRYVRVVFEVRVGNNAIYVTFTVMTLIAF